MRIEVLTKEFKEGLEKAFKVVPKKSSLPILQEVKFEVNDNNLFIHATDTDNFIKTKIELLSSDDEGSFIIKNTSAILKALSSFKEFNTQIEINEFDVTIINGNKKINQAIHEQSEVETFITMNEFEAENTYNYNIKALTNRFNNVKHSLSKEEYKPLFTGLHFNSNDIVTLDGWRMTVSKDTNLNIDNKFTVKAETIDLASKILNNDITIKTNKDKIRIQDKNTIIESKLLVGNFVDYSNLIKNTTEENYEINAKDFADELKYLLQFTTDKSNQIIFNKGNMLVSNENGKYESELKIKDINKLENPVRIGFDGKFMLEAIKQYKDNIILGFIGNDTQLIFIGLDTDLISMIMPVRIK